jgi:hypothetical protein
MPHRYRIRVIGSLDDASRDTFRDLEVEVVAEERLTILSGDLDQPALHGLLERIRALHLDLDDVQRVRETNSRDDDVG